MIKNNSSFTHIGIPDDYDVYNPISPEQLIIKSNDKSNFKEDGVYDPKTGNIIKAPDGYSIIITDKNKGGSIKPKYC